MSGVQNTTWRGFETEEVNGAVYVKIPHSDLRMLKNENANTRNYDQNVGVVLYVLVAITALGAVACGVFASRMEAPAKDGLIFGAVALGASSMGLGMGGWEWRRYGHEHYLGDPRSVMVVRHETREMNYWDLHAKFYNFYDYAGVLRSPSYYSPYPSPRSIFSILSPHECGQRFLKQVYGESLYRERLFNSSSEQLYQALVTAKLLTEEQYKKFVEIMTPAWKAWVVINASKTAVVNLPITTEAELEKGKAERATREQQVASQQAIVQEADHQLQGWAVSQLDESNRPPEVALGVVRDVRNVPPK